MDDADQSQPRLLFESSTSQAAAAARKRAAFVVKSRKSNRVFQVNRLASDLVSCLSEFFASRNIINRVERYEKICNHSDQSSKSTCDLNFQENDLNQKRQQQQQTSSIVSIDLHTQHTSPLPPFRHSATYSEFSCPESANAQEQQSRLPSSYYCRGTNTAQGRPSLSPFKLQPHLAKVKKYNCQDYGASNKKASASSSLPKKHSVNKLLGDLLSGRHESRLLLVGKLLRAPIVLAALFSMSLAISLFILYALSFHHCNHGANNNKLSQVAALVSSSEDGSRAHPLAHDGASEGEDETYSSHRVNSRHLSGVTAQLVERSSQDKQQQQQPVYVKSECGVHEGRADGGAWAFTGIPYASPPVGSRRWKKPRPIWQDTELCRHQSVNQKPATSQSNHCVQFSPFNHRVSGSEDCLYLDIYAPASAIAGAANKSVEKLPVMVYIHGGFLVFGSSNGPSATDEPDDARTSEEEDQVNWMKARPSGQLAAELNVILVAPNYRLQALGFMALRGLASQDNGPDGSEGNYGLWDQLIALRWISRNIESFGGNANNVILFGPDAASALPLALVSQLRAMTSSSPDDGRQNDQQQEKEQQSGQLFKSVWLMNPTIYYELPYELANQHYSRLTWSQSVCSSGSLQAPPRDVTNTPPLPSPQLPRRRPGQSHQAEADQRTGENLQQQKSEKSLIACLMNLTGEQIVREYLGRDQQAFRLDDENSLPIRSIFPDQFVTLDGELVQDSYPFRRLLEQQQQQVEQDREQRRLVKTSDGAGQQEKELRRTGKTIDFLVGSTAQAVEYWPCPENVHAWSWLDFARYVETSLNSFNQPLGGGAVGSEVADTTFKRASELYGATAAAAAAVANKSQLASDGNCNGGSAARDSLPAGAPTCPAGIYLTMVSDIRQVCPSNELARSLALNPRVNSLERYVVEWRPSAQLSRSLSKQQQRQQLMVASGGGENTIAAADDTNAAGSTSELCDTDCGSSGPRLRQSVHERTANVPRDAKAAVSANDKDEKLQEKEEERKDKMAKRTKRQQPATTATAATNAKSSRPTNLLQYAFHYWDLLAFFGFEFDSQLEPSERDLKFQRHLRAMAKRFAWRNQRPGSERTSAPQAHELGQLVGADGHLPVSSSSDQASADHLSIPLTQLFTLDGQVTRDGMAAYKSRECKMWQETLKQSLECAISRAAYQFDELYDAPQPRVRK